ncbi:unnamed protein product [Eruca vesicaria subsp. sativa]|uniref:MADS-box domain-containing protein n=1 Tax=Eruca vesicaria subsp. sativa TaxID=29727 RepID=A0ABC8JLV3_ERUVS|nr:unnamed protein product [Eruca vesicaria subsp. sativa]
MGRGKIEIKKIEDVHRLQACFTNRCKGMMKKANELAVLCDVDVALIAFSRTGELYDFFSGSVEQILSRYGYRADHRQRDTSQGNGDVLLEDESVTSELKRLQLAIERLKGKKLEGMSFSDLSSLESQLNASLLSIKDQKVKTTQRTIFYSKDLKDDSLTCKIESMLGRDSSGPKVSSLLQAEPESSSSDDNENDNEEHHFDTSLRLGWGKK